MTRNQNHCRHPNLLSLRDRVKVCLDCSVLSFNTSKTDHAKFSFFTKPQLFTQKVETVPLSHFHSLFNQIYNDEDSDEKEFSETYKSIRPKLIHHIKTLCISYRVSAKTLYNMGLTEKEIAKFAELSEEEKVIVISEKPYDEVVEEEEIIPVEKPVAKPANATKTTAKKSTAKKSTTKKSSK